MSKYIFIVLLIFGFQSANAHGEHHRGDSLESPILKSALASVQTFAHDYETTYGQKLERELIGLNVQTASDLIEAELFVLSHSASKLKYTYHCQYGYDSCSVFDLSAPMPHGSQGHFFSYSDFVTAIHEAEALYRETTGSPLDISAVKVWQNRTGIEFVFTQSSGTQSFMMCHYHGSHIDCHQKQSAGSGEPR